MGILITHLKILKSSREFSTKKCLQNKHIYTYWSIFMFLLIRFGELTYILMLSKLIENILLLWAQEGKTEEMICNIAAFVQFVSVTSALSYPFHFGKYTNNTRVDLIYFQKSLSQWNICVSSGYNSSKHCTKNIHKPIINFFGKQICNDRFLNRLMYKLLVIVNRSVR